MPVPIIDPLLPLRYLRSENDHYVGHGVAEAQVLEHSEINETRRAHAVTIWVWRAVADQIKSELAFGGFNASISFTDRWTKRAEFDFGIHNWPRLNLGECLLENLNALPHL